VDTLLSVRDFDVGLNMWKLIDSKADLTSIRLDGVRANVVRDETGRFNFDYILDAFATEEKEEPSKPFTISLDKIKLKDIGIRFIDLQARNDLDIYFKSFDTRVRDFDLEANSYAVDQIEMDGLKLKLNQDLVKEVSENVTETVDSLSQSNPLKIDLNGIKFTHFDIDYGDENTQTFAKILFKELRVDVNQIDLKNQVFDIEDLRLSGADIRAELHLAEDVPTQKPDTLISEDNPMKLLLGQLTLVDVEAVYNNTAVVPSRKGMDFNHLDFAQIKLEAEDFLMKNNQFSGRIKSAEIR